MTGKRNELIGRWSGKDVVQLGTHEGTPVRWTFTEITPDSFRWLGELIEPNGTLTVGPHRAESGIVSRKSELRDLRSQAELLDAEIAGTEKNLSDSRDQVDSLSGPIDIVGQVPAEVDLLARCIAELSRLCNDVRIAASPRVGD